MLSPFSSFVESYVVVGFDDLNAKYEYGWMSYDQTGYGMDLVLRDKMKKSDVKGGMTKLVKRPLVGKDVVYLSNKANGCVQEIFDYELELPDDNLPVIMKYKANEKIWKYANKIKNVTFQIDAPIPGGVVESWDVSAALNGKVNAYVIPNAMDANYYDLYIVGKENLYANENSNKMFYGFSVLENINDIRLLNTGRVTRT